MDLPRATTRDIWQPARRYHFIGVGGIGMSALARVLLARGVRVSGSHGSDAPLLDELRALGAEIADHHDAANLHDGDLVVMSDATLPENPERRRAEDTGMDIIRRADLLGYLTNSGRGVAVAGTHGKTTTSGMLALILLEAGFDPTCILGGALAALRGNARAGGPLTVVEACEAYNSFIELHPEVALVTNIEIDHLDFHGTSEHLYESFRIFLRQVRGVAVLNGDDPLLRTMTGLPPRAVTYGAGATHDYGYADPRLGGDTRFTLLRQGAALGEIVLRVPGMHNVSNATGAAAVALELGVALPAIQLALAAFPGMGRRFEHLGTVGAVAVVDDYAHHPTEITATLAAARARYPGTVVAVFMPHLFSRTRDLLDDFAGALTAADVVLVTPIFPARERAEAFPGITHGLLAERIRACAPGKPVMALDTADAAVALLAQAAGGEPAAAQTTLIPALGAGDVILTIGAGDVDRVAHALVQRPAAGTNVQA